MDELHAIANGLLEFETLSGDEVNTLLRGEKIVRDDPSSPSGTGGMKPRRASVPTSGPTPPRDAGDPAPQPGA
jgi:cell division protease FtsH